MERIQAMILSFLITALIAFNFFIIKGISSDTNRENAVILRVIDGDTVELQDGRTIRLLNINAPEKNLPESKYAIDFLKNYENKSIKLEITKLDKYKRSLGRFYSQDYLNLEIVKKGFAHIYIVSEEELPEFKSAQKQAVKAGTGIWNRSFFYGCVSAEINKEEEYVVIENKCDKPLNNILLKDESTKSYALSISANSFLSVYSGKGSATGNASTGVIYLNSDTNIWNNDKDSIFIRDKDGFLIFYDSYGY